MGIWKVYYVKRGRIRIGLSPSGRYALQADCWSPEYEEMETPGDDEVGCESRRSWEHGRVA